MQISKIILSATVALGLVGCGGGSNTNNTAQTPNTKKVQVLDSALIGLDYEMDGKKGTTNEAGQFEYTEGSKVTFSIGDFKLGTVGSKAASNNKIFLPEILGYDEKDYENPEVVQVAQLLLSIDEDNNFENGIDLKNKAKEVAKKAVDNKFQIKTLTLDHIKTMLNGEEPVSKTLAKTHLKSTFNKIQETNSEIKPEDKPKAKSEDKPKVQPENEQKDSASNLNKPLKDDFLVSELSDLKEGAIIVNLNAPLKITFNKQPKVSTLSEIKLIKITDEEKIGLKVELQDKVVTLAHDKPFVNGEKYTLTIPTTVVDKNGKALAKEKVINFSVIPDELKNEKLEIGDKEVQLGETTEFKNKPLVINFNTDISFFENEDDAKTKIKITDDLSSEIIISNIKLEHNKIIIEHEQLKDGKSYIIAIPDNTVKMTLDGNKANKEFGYQFKTTEELKIQEQTELTGDIVKEGSTITLTFSKDIKSIETIELKGTNRETNAYLQKDFDEPKNIQSQEDNKKQIQIHIPSNTLRYNQSYTFILKNIKDIFGNITKELVVDKAIDLTKRGSHLVDVAQENDFKVVENTSAQGLIITIKLYNIPSIVQEELHKIKLVKQADTETNILQYGDIELRDNDENKIIQLKHQQNLESGRYFIIIPEHFEVSDGRKFSKEQKIEFEIK